MGRVGIVYYRMKCVGIGQVGIEWDEMERDGIG